MPAALFIFFAGAWSWCLGRCRGAAALSRQEKNKYADVQRKKSKFYLMLR
jgi:hypothetical protein